MSTDSDILSLPTQQVSTIEIGANGKTIVLNKIAEEVSSPPIFTATLVRPPLPISGNRSFGNLSDDFKNENNYDQQLTATIRLDQNDSCTYQSDKVAIEIEPVFYRKQSKSHSDSIIDSNCYDQTDLPADSNQFNSNANYSQSPTLSVDSKSSPSFTNKCSMNDTMEVQSNSPTERQQSNPNLRFGCTSALVQIDSHSNFYSQTQPEIQNYANVSFPVASTYSSNSVDTLLNEIQTNDNDLSIPEIRYPASDNDDSDDAINSECSSPEIETTVLSPVKFNVPVVIETPCTPEPPELTSNGANNLDFDEKLLESSEEPIAAEYTLSRRRKPKKRTVSEDVEIFDQSSRPGI
jgi:hypothetical protein